MKVKDLDKEVKALQSRLKRAGRFEGMYLNKNYEELMNEVSNIRERIKSKDENLSSQKVSGLIRKLKSIDRSKLMDYIDMYIPELDETFKPVKAPVTRFKIEEVGKRLIEKGKEVIERLKQKYAPPKTEEFIPEPEPPEEEILFSDAVMNHIYMLCSQIGTNVWAALMELITDCINSIGYDETAEWFEENQSEFGEADKLTSQDAKAIYNELYHWALEQRDLAFNKQLTELIERDTDFGDV